MNHTELNDTELIAAVDFEKGAGLVPVVVQDALNLAVLMLGYMNREALEKTLAERRVTFFSRSKQRLWTKGESSQNYLDLVDIKLDCDRDTLLVLAHPHGPTCHTGATTCFGEVEADIAFLKSLQKTIKERHDHPSGQSYTASLFAKGINKVAQKVGEEAVELVIEAKDDNEELFLGEAADLMYHYLVLLRAKGYGLEDVVSVLEKRHR
ncbi:MAG: bifunctional phosphoribosyl-AMP cyclohydrolase/phosphoribosyl-ATP diphosphatase HisIE [Bacteroidota bacterium]